MTPMTPGPKPWITLTPQVVGKVALSVMLMAMGMHYLTPQTPYRIDDVLEAEMKQMDDLESEMRNEIESRRR